MAQPPNSGNWEQPQQPQGGYGGQPRQGGPDAAGFFKAMFDFSFKSFVTAKFAAVIYAIALLLIGIVVAFIAMTEEPLGGFFALLMVLLLAPFYLILVRLTLELYVSMIRTAQNTAATKAELEYLRWDLSQRG